MTDFLQAADSPAFLAKLASLKHCTKHGCDFVKNPIKFYRFTERVIYFYLHTLKGIGGNCVLFTIFVIIIFIVM